MRLTDNTLRVRSWTLFALFVAAGWGSALLLILHPEQSDWGGDGTLANAGFGVMVTLFPLVGTLLVQRSRGTGSAGC